MAEILKILPGTGRGTIRRMVEGHPPVSARLRVPLHPRFAAVPLPVPGRI